MLSSVLRRRASTFVIVLISITLSLSLLYSRLSHSFNFFQYPNRNGHGSSWVNSTLGFHDILVINLPERTDRRDGMVLAAALSEIDLTFVDAVRGEAVLEKARPPKDPGLYIPEANVGSWRGHMNAIREVVERNLGSALILEDDADWDVRIKEQLYDYSFSSRALIQPISKHPLTYADSTYPTPKDASSLPTSNFTVDQLPLTTEPTTSPYGDNWDILWLGHCGMQFPSASYHSGEKIPKGRVVRYDDQTVPEQDHLETVSSVNNLKDDYPPHTRVVHHVADGICSLGYAISQAGARRLLYWLGLMETTGPFDVMLRQFCEGTAGKPHHTCLTVQPGLFQHHRPAGNKTFESDITDHGTLYREKAMTDIIRWSVRMNIQVLLDGSENFVDQFPDTG